MTSAANLDVDRPIAITGGAGFIGSNLAHRLLSAGHDIIVLDNLSRPRVHENLRWLVATHRHKARVDIGDVRDPVAVRRALCDVGGVFHLAAQVAVTTSLEDPGRDFETNLRGTFNVL